MPVIFMYYPRDINYRSKPNNTLRENEYDRVKRKVIDSFNKRNPSFRMNYHKMNSKTRKVFDTEFIKVSSDEKI